MRRLLCTRRHIPLDRLDDYMSGWQQVRGAAEDAGARAWLFRGAAHQDQFAEFIEWQDDAVVVPEAAAVADARLRLDETFGSGHVVEWEEASLREGA
jgi:hypothetical protein